MARGEREIQLVRPQRILNLTPRDFVSVLFRHRKTVTWTFSLVFVSIMIFAIVRQPSYRSQMTILVNRERMDPVVTADRNLVQRVLPGITAEEVNSEMALLKTNDLLRQVVLACGLDSAKPKSMLGRFKGWLTMRAGDVSSPDLRIARAERKLASDLQVELVPKTTLLSVSYSSPNPELSARVLSHLSELYLRQHSAVHRPAGALEFFRREADGYHRQLQDAEKRLEELSRVNHVGSIDSEREAALKKLIDLQLSRHETAASIEVTNQKLLTLNNQMSKLQPRLTTQVRRQTSRPADQLQSTLLALELKRTELLTIFKPDYPPVKEVEEQIAKAKTAVADSQGWQVVEETTDRDSTYEWLRAEIEKATIDLASLRSEERSIDDMIVKFEDKAARLNDLEIQRSDLLRSAKLAEAAYITYQNKQEEARISDTLDSQRILNVAIADKPFVPVLSSSLSGSIVILLGMILASFASVAMAFGIDNLDTRFRTPQEVQQLLDVQVVAAIPERCS